MEITTQNIESAVQQFYYDTSLQQEVHKWLTLAQVAPEAWTFCWDLLSPNKAVEVQFFGASTLHVKISRYWKEVPPQQYHSLRSQLFEKIFQFSQGPKMVLTRLCVAMSALALHTMPEAWPDPVQDMISTFQQENIPQLDSVQKCVVLLDLLTVLPEEFITLNLTAHKRGLLRHDLEKALKHVLPLLQGIMNPSSPSAVYDQALRCFSSWVEFGVPILDCQGLIQQVFQAIHNEQLFETSIDALVNVFSHPEAHRYPNTIQKLLPQVLHLQDVFHKASQDSDSETCQGICRLVVSVAENHSRMFVESIYGEEAVRTNALNFINMVLSCTSASGHYPVDESYSDLSFTFWYILQDDIVTLDPDKHRIVLPVLQPIYLALMEVLLVKVQHPEASEFESWSAEEKEQFRCYRQDIGDTMMYAFNILREPLLGHMCNMLGNLLEKSNEQSIRWQVIEAVFFLFGSVAESIDLDEDVYLPGLLNMLPRIPFNNIKLISTALYMIGSFGEWLSYHPDCLGCVIPLLLQGMENQEVATAATMALKDVTRETLDHINPYAHQILTACKNALESNSLKSRENVRIMSSVGQVLSVMPYGDIMQYLNAILTPHLNQLEEYSKQSPSASVKAGILLKLNMISWLFASLNTERDEGEEPDQPTPPKQPSTDPKPVYVILQQICPLINHIVQTWINDSGVMEATCELFKRALRTLMEDFAPLSNEITQLLIRIYQTVPYAVVLDISKQMIIMFSKNKDFAETTRTLFCAVCGKTLSLFQSGAAIQEYTDVVEEFMNFMAQITKKCKHLLSRDTCSLEGIFQAGIIGLSLPENHTVKAACFFLVEFISSGSLNPDIQEVTLSNAHHLVEQMLQSIGGSSPRGVMDMISDVLLALCKAHVSHINNWLGAMVDREGFPSVRVAKEDKAQFVKNILRHPTNKQRIRQTVKEFTLLCRGILGTEYAAQAAALI